MLETVRERQIETNNKTEIAMWLVYVYLVLPCGSLFYTHTYIYILPKKKNYLFTIMLLCLGRVVRAIQMLNRITELPESK